MPSANYTFGHLLFFASDSNTWQCMMAVIYDYSILFLDNIPSGAYALTLNYIVNMFAFVIQKVKYE